MPVIYISGTNIIERTIIEIPSIKRHVAGMLLI